MVDGRIIALYGYPGAGKDAVASFLVEKGGWTRVAFADPIREMLLALNPLILVGTLAGGNYVEVRLQELVATYIGGFDTVKRKFPEVRRLLQVLGSEGGRDILGDDLWVNAADRRIDKALETGNVVVSDLRFPNEFRYLCLKGATIVKVWRPGCEAVNGHQSEQHYGYFVPDFILHNDGDLAMLRESVETLLKDRHFNDLARW